MQSREERAEACLRRGRKEREHGFAKERTKRQYSDCRVSQKRRKRLTIQETYTHFKRHKRTKNDMKREYLSVKTLKFKRFFGILSSYRIQCSQSMKKTAKNSIQVTKNALNQT